MCSQFPPRLSSPTLDESQVTTWSTLARFWHASVSCSSLPCTSFTGRVQCFASARLSRNSSLVQERSKRLVVADSRTFRTAVAIGEGVSHQPLQFHPTIRELPLTLKPQVSKIKPLAVPLALPANTHRPSASSASAEHPGALLVELPVLLALLLVRTRSLGRPLPRKLDLGCGRTMKVLV